MGANLGDLAHSTKMTGRGGVAVVPSTTEMERMDDGVPEVGGGNSVEDIAYSTNAMERSTPALCILVPRSRVCHSLWGTRHENTQGHQGWDIRKGKGESVSLCEEAHRKAV